MEDIVAAVTQEDLSSEKLRELCEKVKEIDTESTYFDDVSQILAANDNNDVIFTRIAMLTLAYISVDRKSRLLKMILCRSLVTEIFIRTNHESCKGVVMTILETIAATIPFGLVFIWTEVVPGNNCFALFLSTRFDHSPEIRDQFWRIVTYIVAGDKGMKSIFGKVLMEEILEGLSSETSCILREMVTSHHENVLIVLKTKSLSTLQGLIKQGDKNAIYAALEIAKECRISSEMKLAEASPLFNLSTTGGLMRTGAAGVALLAELINASDTLGSRLLQANAIDMKMLEAYIQGTPEERSASLELIKSITNMGKKSSENYILFLHMKDSVQILKQRMNELVGKSDAEEERMEKFRSNVHRLKEIEKEINRFFNEPSPESQVAELRAQVDVLKRELEEAKRMQGSGETNLLIEEAHSLRNKVLEQQLEIRRLWSLLGRDEE